MEVGHAKKKAKKKNAEDHVMLRCKHKVSLQPLLLKNKPSYTHTYTLTMLTYKFLLLASLLSISSAFAPHHTSALNTIQPTRQLPLFAETVSQGDITTAADDEEEWVEEEYEDLTEQDFYGSEWRVGTLMDGSNKIVETWCRCVVKDGQFVAIWGDGAEGKWAFDTASQFFSITKDSWGGWFGKKIWAGTVDDYYFMDGTVRGWGPISPASVVGQWQMKRLGVDPEEAGTAPWFETDDEDGKKEEESSSEA